MTRIHRHERPAARRTAPLLIALTALAGPTWSESTQDAGAAAEAAGDPAETPAELLARGRGLLAAGRAEAALESLEKALEEAGAESPEGVEAGVWLARAWLALDRVDDALGLTDELKARGAAAADLDYLYGLGFLGAAKREAAGGGGTYTQGQFQDATAFLAKATEADAERYGDAFLPLAEAAWYAGELELARAAAERAVERAPADTGALVQRGKIAFSRYTQARGDGQPGEAEQALWTATREAFQAAAAAYGKPTEELPQFELAGVHEELANLHLWREDRDAAAEAFVRALAWDPRALDSADFNRLRESLGDERFEATTARGLEAFEARHGSAAGGDATPHPGGPLLAWWAGYAAFVNADLPAAEKHFARAVQSPGYLNSWYYVFRSAYGQRRYDPALIALRTYWQQDPDGLLALMAGQQELNLRILEYLVGWLIDAEQQDRERYAEAAVLADIMTRLVPGEARYWNNLGLFLRDYGDQLKRLRPPYVAAELAELFERAFVAYERTLELAPDHPAYLNDTAVMLHYYLERDYDRAEAMYQRAIERAEEELAAGRLSTSDSGWFDSARTDALDNLEKLRAKRAAAEPSPREP